MSEELPVLDVAIIGAGPAGMSAGVWCTELGLSVAMFEREASAGGQLRHIFNPINNYLGLSARNGAELCERFIANVNAAAVAMHRTSEVVEIGVEPPTVHVRDGRVWRARSVILATGVRRRRLGVPGEDSLAGKGIIVSGARDREIARGKAAVIVGGGDAALENALMLSEHASRVLVIHRGKTFRAREEFIQAAEGRLNIEFAFEMTVNSINGGDRVRSVSVSDNANGETKIIAADIVLIRVGVEPNSELLKDKADIGRDGYVIVDNLCRTSAQNIYAVGDVANPVSPTIATAAGTGATVAKEILKG